MVSLQRATETVILQLSPFSYRDGLYRGLQRRLDNITTGPISYRDDLYRGLQRRLDNITNGPFSYRDGLYRGLETVR